MPLRAARDSFLAFFTPSIKKDSNGRSKLIKMFLIISISLALRNSSLFPIAEGVLTVVVKVFWFSVGLFSVSKLLGIAFGVVVADEVGDVLSF